MRWLRRVLEDLAAQGLATENGWLWIGYPVPVYRAGEPRRATGPDARRGRDCTRADDQQPPGLREQLDDRP